MPKESAPPAEKLELAAFRMPRDLRQKAKSSARSRDMSFSQLMRKALRRELGLEAAR